MGTAPFADAFDAGIDEYLADSKSDPQFHIVDVKTMRGKGVLPVPQ